MKTFKLKATFKATVHMEVKAKSKRDALAEAEAQCFCVTPMFYPGAHNYEKPKLIQLDECAWFDADELDNQLIWEHESKT